VVSRWRAAFWGLVAVVLTAVLTWGIATGAYGSPPGALGQVRRLLHSPGLADLARGLALIQTQYYGRTDPGRLGQAALEGAVRSLGDPYSAYLTPAAYQALRSSTSGRYTGIGVEVQQGPDGLPVVLRVFAGSPAATTPYQGQGAGTPPGLRAGDRLLAVDGQSVRGMPEEQVRSLIVGPRGTAVTVDVLRSGAGGPQTLRFRLVREPVQVQTVVARLLPDGVGYLDIQMFNEQTPAQAQAAVEGLRAQGMRALVVDLRDNPGGLLDSAVGVARLLLPGGVVAYLQPRSGPRQAVRLSSPRPVGVPYAVLVDGYTASAAELLAGAVQDDGAGLLVGERTFGKGSVQKIFPLSGGAALKLTVAHYLTPKGRDPSDRGIAPDVEVPWPGHTTADMGDPAKDPQLDAALRHLAAVTG
jgi:carboxyl-terminal processing protease